MKLRPITTGDAQERIIVADICIDTRKIIIITHCSIPALLGGSALFSMFGN